MHLSKMSLANISIIGAMCIYNVVTAGTLNLVLPNESGIFPIDFGEPVDAIVSFSVSTTGIWTPYELCCNYDPGWDPPPPCTPGPSLPLYLGVIIHSDSSSFYFEIDNGHETGISAPVEFQADNLSNLSISFASGVGQIEIVYDSIDLWGFIQINRCSITAEGSIELTEPVSLSIVYSPAVANDSVSWGAVKSRYRQK